MRAVLPLFALLGLALRAGCSFATSDAPGTLGPTLTPVEFGTTTPTDSAVEYPGTPFPATATRPPARTPHALPSGYETTGIDVLVASLVHGHEFENQSNYRPVAESPAEGGDRDGWVETRHLFDGGTHLVERRVDGSLSLAVYERDGTVFAQRYDPASSRSWLRSCSVTVVDRQAFDVLQ
jgi:hypothetical protein